MTPKPPLRRTSDPITPVSWWLTPMSREEFSQRQVEEQDRMAQSPSGRVLRPQPYGDLR